MKAIPSNVMNAAATHRARKAAALASALVLASCAVGPDYQPPDVPVPERWAGISNMTPASQPQLAQWWTRLNDPLLDALIDEAVAGNLDVATARAKVREARAVYRQTAGASWPALRGSLSETRSGGSGRMLSGASNAGSSNASTNSNTNSNAGTGSPGDLFQAGFDASWELDVFGANRRAAQAAKYGIDAAQWGLGATLLTLVGDVASSYVQARGYQARLALARDTAASQEETARITRLKFEAGATSGLDAANAAGAAQSTRAAIPAFEAAYAQTVHSLSVLTGQPPEALLQRMKQPRVLPTPTLPVSLGVPADVLLARPDVRAAERRYAQSTAKVGQAEAARYPSVSLTGSIVTSATRPGDLGQRSSIGWSFGPSLTVPLFDGGRLKAGVEVAQAERDQSFIAWRAAVLNALKDVEGASVALYEESERTAALRESVASYRTATDLARMLYRAGSTSFLDVLTAERSLYLAEDTLIQSRVLFTTYYVALNKALGGGWNGHIDTSVSEVTDTHTGPHFDTTRD